MTKSRGIGRGGARKGAGCKPKVLPPSKVFENFRNHPSRKHDETALVFKIGKKVYLIGDGTVRQIIPRTVYKTNIGEPYKDLARMCFVFAEGTDRSHWSIDFDYSFEDELKALIVI
jgi:hypothetical protein